MKPLRYTFTPSLISTLKEKLEKRSENGLLISLIINESDESIGLSEKSNEYHTIEDLKDLNTSQYILYSVPYYENDKPVSPSKRNKYVSENCVYMFILFNPPNSITKTKILYSYTKGAVTEQLSKLGIEIFKSVDVDDYEELCSAVKSIEKTEFTAVSPSNEYLKPFPAGRMPWIPTNA